MGNLAGKCAPCHQHKTIREAHDAQALARLIERG
jgi:hypothetical protein